jgi:hypothetical protein
MVIDFPTEILSKSLRQGIGVAASIHGHMMLETILAEEVQQGLKLRHLAPGAYSPDSSAAQSIDHLFIK